MRIVRIESSAVSLSASRTFTSTETRVVRAGITVGPRAATVAAAPATDRGPAVAVPRGRPPDHAPAHGLRALQARAAAPDPRSVSSGAAPVPAVDEGCDELGLTPNLRVALALIEALTGRPVQLLTSRDLAGEPASAPGGTDLAGPAPAPMRPEGAVGGPAWEVRLDAYHRREEFEQTIVTASASVTTSDGMRRQLDLELRMSRHVVEEQLVSLRLAGGGEPVDPLIVTLGPDLARFGSDSLSFDLDLDGSPDTVRLTAGRSAYLVEDRDGSGTITDGSELFGPRTGDGFAELAAHDVDGNGWIDAADPIYHRLALAVADGSGGVRLRSLADAGVAAIGVTSVASPFLITDAAGPVGQVQATGLVLLASGKVGTVQHVDLLL